MNKEETILEIITWIVLLVALGGYFAFVDISRGTFQDPDETWKLVVGVMDTVLFAGAIALSIRKRYGGGEKESSKPEVSKAKIPHSLDKNLSWWGFAWALLIFVGGMSILSLFIYSQQ